MTGDVVAAIDVGGTTVKGALVGADGSFSGEVVVPTDVERGPDAVVASVREIARALSAASSVRAIGVVVPGSVDPAAGIARFSANLGWRDVPLRALLEQDARLPVALGHDVAAAGLADAACGATVGTQHSLLVVIGTGIAAVVRSAGQVVVGGSGTAGELGHVPVYPDGEPCPCGQRGCLERYASAAAISRAYASLGGRSISADQVAVLRTSDAAAARAWDRAIDALALALASATMVLDPEVIALAGGLSAAGDALVEPLRASLAVRVTWRPPPRVVVSPLGARAGLIGASLLARAQL